MIIGAHVGSNIMEEIDDIHKYGGKIIQLFVKITEKRSKYISIKKKLEKKGMHSIVHASYSINLAKDWTQYSHYVKQFIAEIEIAHILNAKGIVVHMGKQLNISEPLAINNMYSSLLHIHSQTKDLNVPILIETSTGQGSELCWKLSEFTRFFKKLSNHNMQDIRDRFGICLDTCHIFSAGYDIKTKENVRYLMYEIEKEIGLRWIKLIHLNDSKKDLGSRIDRHANIGEGHIGKEGLYAVMTSMSGIGIPIILETPDYMHDLREIMM